jgi:uncharacterized protein (DUF3820 family)
MMSNLIIRFGKYRGKSFHDIKDDLAYLRWALKKDCLKAPLYGVVCEHLLNQIHQFRMMTYRELIDQHVFLDNNFHQGWYRKLQDYYDDVYRTELELKKCISCCKEQPSSIINEEGICIDCASSPRNSYTIVSLNGESY